MTEAENALLSASVEGDYETMHELRKAVLRERTPRDLMEQAEQARRDVVRAQERFDAAISRIPFELRGDVFKIDRPKAVD